MGDQVLSRQELLDNAGPIKTMLYHAILSAHDSKITEDAFAEVLLEVLYTYTLVTRAELLETISLKLVENRLTERLIHNTQNYLSRRCDRNCAKVAGLMELIEETKTDGPRH